MANNILLKKSSVAAKVPTTGDLDYGELALNYADGALYYKTSGNTIARLNPLEADTLATVTGRGATTSTAITVGGLTSNGAAEFKSSVGFFTATLNPTVELRYGSTWNNGRLQVLNGPTVMWEFGPSAVTSQVPITIAGGNFNVSSGSATVSGDITAGGLFRVSDGAAIRCVNTGPSGSFYLDSPVITWRNPSTSYSTLAQITPTGLSIAPTTASTTTSSGALIVSGGVGVAGAINAGGAVTTTGLTVNGASSLAGDVTNVDSISFDLTAAEATGIGKLYWDAGVGELRYGLGGGNVDLAIGQMQVTYVRNAETSTITKGQVVYLFGAQGDRPSVKLASNTSDTTSNKTFGIAAENIAANSDGYIVNVGTITGIDTSMYSPGDILWLGSTAGTFTTTKAVAPNHLVFIGVVQKANQGAGQIYVRVQNGYELDEIHDVLISGIGLNHSLFYDTSVNVWKNYAPSAARTNLGLGTIATQNANNVSITGGAIDGTPIGVTTPSTGKFTTLQTTGNVTVGGNLTVSGTTTTVNAQNLSISDNLIYLNEGSTNSNPDIGFAANYNDGTYAHAGFFRDATDGYWKVFKNYTPEPDASIYIDTSHASFALADIQAANFRGALVGNAMTASTLAGTPTINGVTFNGGSNITITASTTNALTIGDGLSGTSFNGSAAVTIAADSTIARRSDVHYIGTTSIALNRASAAQTLTGINGLTAVGTNQSITLTPTGTGGVGIGTSSPNELLSIGYIDGSYGRIEFRSASYARQAIIEGVDDASGGNGHLAIYTRNSGNVYERLRVTSTGRLGIGTTNPTAKIHAVSGAAYLRATLESETTPQIIISNGTQIINFGINGDVIPSVTAQSNDPLVFGTNNIERARFSATGNFGVGTNNPTTRLAVFDSADSLALFSSTANTGDAYITVNKDSNLGGDSAIAFARLGTTKWKIGNAGGYSDGFFISRADSSGAKIFIDISGNVGIGTITPSSILDARLSSGATSGFRFKGYSDASTDYLLSLGTQTYPDVFQVKSVNGLVTMGVVGAVGATPDLVLQTNSTERIRILSGGNVGVGTASPSQKLEVTGNIKLTNGGYIYGDGSNAQLHLSNALGSQLIYGSVAVRALAASVKLVATSEEISLVNNNGSLWLSGAGNVGIATSSPAHKLDINGNVNISSGNPLRWGSGNAEIVDSTYNLLFKVYDGTSSVQERVRITSAGNVGIGTTSPLYNLHVSGSIYSVMGGTDGGQIRLANSGGGSTWYWAARTTGLNLGELAQADGRLFIQNGGNVGIGTTTPGQKLEVNGNALFSGGSIFLTNGLGRISSDGAGEIGIDYSSSATATNVFSVYNGSTVALFTVARSTGNAYVSGNLGVGTSSPSYKLHVIGDARMGTNGQRLYFYDDGNAHIHSTSTPLWINAEDNTSNIYINHQYNGGVILTKAGGGNVGIGEASPTQKLHVAGNARITGAIYDSANSAGTNGQVLTSTGTGTAWSSSGVAVSGTGTAGKIAKWSATTALADSVITESSGNIGIDTTPTQKLDVNGNIGWSTDYVLSSSTITTTSTTANQVITSVAATSFRTFKFIIQATDATAGKYQSQEILAVHNGSTVAHTEYTAINVGGAVATYDVDISGGTVRLLCTPLSANGTVFKVSMQLIKV